MDIKQLRYFIAVAQQGSLSAAARTLHIVQPALSQAMAGLEAELGAELFTRSPSGIALTASGAELLQHAQRILKQLDQAEQAVRSASQHISGVVRIGILHSAAPLVCAPLFKKLREEAPGIQPQLIVGYSNELEARLTRGELDLTMLVIGGKQSVEPACLLYEETLSLLTPKSALTAFPGPLSLKHLQQIPLVLSVAQPLHRALLAAAKEEKVQLKLVGGVEDIRALVELCQDCKLSTLLPGGLAQLIAQDTKLVAKLISHPAFNRRVILRFSTTLPKTPAGIAVEQAMRAILAPPLAEEEGHQPH